MLRPLTLPEHIIVPYRVIIDSREQHPYAFKGFTGDKSQKNLPIVVPTVVAGLKTGDYSIEGFEDRVGIERKSLSDLYSTLGQGRERFRAEFERLHDLECPALVIEAGWPDIIRSPPEQSKLNPKVVYRTLISWSQRWRIPVYTCDTRDLAERTVFRILDWFWHEEEWKRKQGETK